MSENTTQFKPPLAAGTIVAAFGVICILIGTSVVPPKEESEALRSSPLVSNWFQLLLLPRQNILHLLKIFFEED